MHKLYAGHAPLWAASLGPPLYAKSFHVIVDRLCTSIEGKIGRFDILYVHVTI